MFTSTLIILLSVLFTVQAVEYFDNLVPSNPNKCQLPRIRRSWIDISDEDKSDYVRLIAQMKLYTKIPSNFYPPPTLFDYFSTTHNTYTTYYHGCSFFFPAHRYLVWKFETALQFIARVVGPTLSPPINNPCITIPYWPWDLDAELNINDDAFPQNHSAIFDLGLFGPPPDPNQHTNFTVPNGTFAGWTVPTAFTIGCGGSTCFSNKAYGPLSKELMRWFSPSSYFYLDPTQLMSGYINQPQYLPFATLEGYHFLIHDWLGYIMSTQYSPSEPLFWVHHANVDRLFAIWQDCNDYELFNSSTINSTMYTPQTKPGLNFNFTLDSIIPYTSSSDIGPFTKQTPTARQVYFMGNENELGWDGIYYRYGPDDIVETTGFIGGKPTCPNNRAGWNLVNQTVPGYVQKRGVSQNDNDTIPLLTANLTNRQQVKLLIQEWIVLAEAEGLSGSEALQFAADLACRASPQFEVSSDFENLLIMMEVDVSTLDRSCDAVSQRFCHKRRGTHHKWCKGYEESQTSPTWFIVVAVVGVLLVVVIGVVVYRLVANRSLQQPIGDEKEYSRL